MFDAFLCEINSCNSTSAHTLVSNPQNCRLPVYVSFLFAPPRMSNSSLFVLPLIGAPSSFVRIHPYLSLFVPNWLPGHRNKCAVHEVEKEGGLYRCHESKIVILK